MRAMRSIMLCHRLTINSWCVRGGVFAIFINSAVIRHTEIFLLLRCRHLTRTWLVVVCMSNLNYPNVFIFLSCHFHIHVDFLQVQSGAKRNCTQQSVVGVKLERFARRSQIYIHTPLSLLPNPIQVLTPSIICNGHQFRTILSSCAESKHMHVCVTVPKSLSHRLLISTLLHKITNGFQFPRKVLVGEPCCLPFDGGAMVCKMAKRPEGQKWTFEEHVRTYVDISALEYLLSMYAAVTCFRLWCTYGVCIYNLHTHIRSSVVCVFV